MSSNRRSRHWGLTRSPWFFLFLSAALCGCRRATTEATAIPGAPLPGLDAAELDRFTRGRALFDRDFSPEQGLGPLFNQKRCSGCHDIPTVGGMGAENVR